MPPSKKRDMERSEIMGGEVCYRKGGERGPWYAIECVRRDILSKEDRGINATFERCLLKSWSEYPGWEGAGKPLRQS